MSANINNGRQVVHITIGEDEADVRVDRWMKRHYSSLTQGQVEKMCRTGQVRVDGARVKPNTRILSGQTVRVPPLPERDTSGDDAPWKTYQRNDADADFMRSMVIYQDKELIALNKPAGLAVQGGTSTRRHVDGMLEHLQDGPHRPKLVHRLDRDTSGVLVVAKTPAAAARLAELFRGRDMDKVYWAVTVGTPVPNAGQIRCWMIKDMDGDDKERMRRSGHGEKGAVHSVTDYAVVSQAGQRAAWVALKPQTGRTHQLRFHMEELGTAILGDTKYPPVREIPHGLARGLHLHARAILIPRPNAKPLTIIAPLPEQMQETFAALGFLETEAGKDPLAPFA